MDKRSIWSRLIAMILAVAMVLTSQPVSVLASEGFPDIIGVSNGGNSGTSGNGGISTIAGEVPSGVPEGALNFEKWIDSATLWYKDESGEWIKITEGTDWSGVNITDATEIKMELDFGVPSDVTIKSGDQIYVKIPNNFVSKAGQSGNVTDSAGKFTSLGSYEIKDDYIIITYSQSNIKDGHIEFEGTLTASESGEGGGKTEVGVHEFKWDVPVQRDPSNVKKDIKIDKTDRNAEAEIDENGDIILKYRIKVTAPSDNTERLEDLVIEDVFGEGAEYVIEYIEDSISYSGDNKGRIKAAQGETLVVRPTFDNQNHKATFNIEGEDAYLESGEEFRFYYKVRIRKEFFEKAGADGVIKNNATVTGKGGVSHQDSASFKAPEMNPLTKTSVVEDGRIKHTIEVNQGFLTNFKDRTWTLEDNMKNQYIDGEIEITGKDTNKKTVTNNNKPVLTPEEANANEKTGFTWKIPEGRTHWTIEYYTIPVGDSGECENDALLKYNETGDHYGDHTGVPIGGSYTVEKSARLSAADYENKSIHWTVKLDNTSVGGNWIPEGSVYKDDLQCSSEEIDHYKVKQNTLTITDADGKKLEEDIDYVVKWTKHTSDRDDEKELDTFEVTFSKRQKGPLLIEYDTTMDLYAEGIRNPNDVGFRNYGELFVNNESVGKDDEEIRPYLDVNIRKETSGYDRTTGNIPWEIYLNEGTDENGNKSDRKKIPDKDIIVTDKIPEGLEYVEGSLKVWRRSDYGGTSWKQQGEDYEEDEIKWIATYDESAKELKIEFTGGMTGNAVKITFETRIKDGTSFSEGKTYTNTAEVSFASITKSATDSVTVEDHALEKTAAYNNDTAPYVYYTLQVNPNAFTYGIGDVRPKTIVVQDSISSESDVLYPQWIKVYPMLANGKKDETNPLVENIDYFVTKMDDRTFSVEVPNGKALIIEYACRTTKTVPGDGIKVKLDNTATLYVNSTFVGSDVFNDEKEVVKSKASGSTAEELGITIFKRDGEVSSAETYLSGAEFEFGEANVTKSGDGTYNVEKASPQGEFPKTLSVDDGGELKITKDNGLDYNKWYYFVETEAPEGYVKDTTVHYFTIPGAGITTEQEKANNAIKEGKVSPSAKGVASYSVNLEANTYYYVDNFKGSITVEKMVSGKIPEGSENEEFEVTITGSSSLKDAYSPNYKVEWDETNPNTVKIKVKAGESVTVKNLPIGTYTVEETIDGKTYTAAYAVSEGNRTEGSEACTVELTETAKDGTVTITNTYAEEKGSLSITKEVTGDSKPENGSYKVTVTAPEGADLSKVTASSSVDGIEDLNVDNSKGTITFSFKNGEIVTLKDLPKGTYTVTEENEDGRFSQTYKVNEEPVKDGTIEVLAGETATMTVENHYPDEGELLVVKERDLAGGEATDEMVTIRVMVDNPVYYGFAGWGGRWINPFEHATVMVNGVAKECMPKTEVKNGQTHHYIEFELKIGQQASIKGLMVDRVGWQSLGGEWNFSYTVTEIHDGNFVASYSLNGTDLGSSAPTVKLQRETTNANKVTVKNRYPKPAKLSLKGTKSLLGGELTKDAYEFKLTADPGNPAGATLPNLVTVKNKDPRAEDGFGVFTFGDITFTKAGTYIFYVEEVTDGADADSSVTYDKSKYTVKVEVKLDEESHDYVVKKVDVTKDGETVKRKVKEGVCKLVSEGAAFINKKKGSLTVTKTVKGETKVSGKFYTIEVTNDKLSSDEWEKIAKANKSVELVTEESKNIGVSFTVKPSESTDGTTLVAEKKLENLPEGTYTVKEMTAEGDKFLASYTVTAKDDTQNSNGAVVQIDLGEAAQAGVVNTYPAKASVTVDGTKTIEGIESTNKTFTFILQETDADFTTPKVGGVTRTATVNGFATAEGKSKTFTFDAIKYTEEGTYYYVVSEDVMTDQGGFTLDAQKYRVTVEVKRQMERGVYRLVPTKTVQRKVTAAGGVETWETVAEGKITFTNKYTYGSLTIHKSVTPAGVNSDETYVIKVKYLGTEGSLADAMVLVNGENPADGMVTKGGNTITLTLKADDVASLDKLPVGLYEVYEIKDGGDIYTAVVEVSGTSEIGSDITSEEGETVAAGKVLSLTIDHPNAKVEVENTYPTTGSLTVTKQLNGSWQPTEGSYEITVMTGDAPASVANAEVAIDGEDQSVTPSGNKLVFSLGKDQRAKITGLVPGNYTVQETGTNKGDTVTYNVTATDGSTGTANEDSANVTIAKEGTADVTVTNSYDNRGSLTIKKTAVQTANGVNVPADAEYEITVTGADGQNLDGAEVDGEVAGSLKENVTGSDPGIVVSLTFKVRAGGKVMVSNLPIGTYTVTEATGNYRAEITVDSTSAGTGTDTGSATLGGEKTSAEFTVTNTYPAKGTMNLKGTKALLNNPAADGTIPGFFFTLEQTEGIGREKDIWAISEDSDEEHKVTVENDPNGNFQFNNVMEFTATGTYHFTVSEQIPDTAAENMDLSSYDKREYQVEVEVVYNADSNSYQVKSVVMKDKDGTVLKTYGTEDSDDTEWPSDNVFELPKQTVKADNGTETALASFVNEVTRGDLTIVKTVNHNGIATRDQEDSRTFYFQVSRTTETGVTYCDKDGKEYAEAEKAEAVIALEYSSATEAANSVTVKNLPAGTYTVTEVNADGSALKDNFPYEVTVKVKKNEEVVEGSTVEVAAGDAHGNKTVTITNTRKVTSVNGSKTWNAPAEKIPESITVKLLRDGKEYATKTVEEGTEGNWAYSFENLPKYDKDGNKYNYTVNEDVPEGYDVTTNGTNLINTWKNGSLTIYKKLAGPVETQPNPAIEYTMKIAPYDFTLTEEQWGAIVKANAEAEPVVTLTLGEPDAEGIITSATVTVRGNEEVTIKKLPIGNYMITEETMGFFNTTYSDNPTDAGTASESVTVKVIADEPGATVAVAAVTNTYPDQAVLGLSGTKALIAGTKTLVANQYSFTLEETTTDTSLPDVLTGVVTVQNSAETGDGVGTFSFTGLKFSAKGTYTFTVKETADSDSSVEYDGTVYDVTVDVAEGEGNKFVVDKVTITEQGNTENTVTYSRNAETGDLEIPADGICALPQREVDEATASYINREKGSLTVTKIVQGNTAPASVSTNYMVNITGGGLTSDEWEAIAEANTAAIPTLIVDPADSTNYTGIQLTLAVTGEGTAEKTLTNLPANRTYTVEEVIPDSSRFVANYTVNSASAIETNAAVEIVPGGTAEVGILNTYPDRTQLQLGGTKEIEVPGFTDENETLNAGTFTFTLYKAASDTYTYTEADKIGEPQTVGNGGKFTFAPIDYPATGEEYTIDSLTDGSSQDYYYVVKETAVSADGFTANTQEYHVHVKVTAETDSETNEISLKAKLEDVVLVTYGKDGSPVTTEDVTGRITTMEEIGGETGVPLLTADGFNFTNTYQYGTLTVHKVVTATTGTAPTGVEYTIYVESANGTAALTEDSGVLVAIDDAATPTKAEVDGQGRIVLTLKADQTATLTHLPAGVYKVTELVDGKLFTADFKVNEGTTASIPDLTTATGAGVAFSTQAGESMNVAVTVTNNYPNEGELSVTKSATGSWAEAGPYNFRVTAEEGQGFDDLSEATVTIKEGDTDAADPVYEAKEDVITFSLTDGQTATITGLTPGNYLVQETNADGTVNEKDYTTTYTVNGTDTTPNADGAVRVEVGADDPAFAAVVVENHYPDVGQLEITKSVIDSFGTKLEEGIYEIQVKANTYDLTGAKVTGATAGENGVVPGSVHQEGNIITFQLRVGGTGNGDAKATITNLPKDTYTITEMTTGKEYQASYSGGGNSATVTLTDTDSVGNATVTNTYPNVARLTFTGTKALANGDIAGDRGAFEFTIAQDKDKDNAADVEIANDTVSNNKTENFAFAPLTFRKSGDYWFTIQEKIPAEADPAIDYDFTVYTAHVHVAYKDNTYYVDEVEITGNDENKTSVTYSTADSTLTETDGVSSAALPERTTMAADGTTEVKGSLINTLTKGNLIITKNVFNVEAGFRDTFYFHVTRTVTTGAEEVTYYYYYGADGKLQESTTQGTLALECAGATASLMLKDLEPGNYTVTEVDADGNELTNTYLYAVSYPNPTGGNVEVKAGQDAEVQVQNDKVLGKINVTKEVTGTWGSGDSFYAALYRQNAGGTETLVEGQTNPKEITASSSTVTFENLEPGTYVVYETDEDGNKLTAGSVVGNYVVDTRNGAGQSVTLTTRDNTGEVTLAPEASVTLMNTTHETTLNLLGSKAAVNIPENGATFVFEVRNTDGTTVATGSYTAEGPDEEGTYPAHEFELNPVGDAFTYSLDDLGGAELKTFTYTVVEVIGTEENVYYDTDNERTLNVTVGLTKDAAGMVTGIEIQSVTIDGKEVETQIDAAGMTRYALGSAADNAGTFTNFTPNPISIQIPVRKNVTGPLTDLALRKVFTFTLARQAVTGESADDVYTLADDTKTAFSSSTVTVTANGTGSGIHYGTGLFEGLWFRKAGTYTFELTENELATGDNDGTTIDGYTKDQSRYEIKIEVGLKAGTQDLEIKNATWQQTVDSRGNALTGDALEDPTPFGTGLAETRPEFTNEYAVEGTSAAVDAQKAVETEVGVPAPDVDFTFELTAKFSDLTAESGKNNADMGWADASYSTPYGTQTVTVKAGEKKDFPTIYFDAAGTYTYEMREQLPNPTRPGWETSGDVYTITFTVVDNNGKLAVTSTKKMLQTAEGAEGAGAEEDYSTITFTNRYGVTAAEYTLPVSKEITGEAPTVTKKDFTFTLRAGAGNNNTGYGLADPAGSEEFIPFTPQTVTVTGAETKLFEKLRFTKPGEYRFTLVENDFSAEEDEGYTGYTKDNTIYEILVTVTDVDSQLTASALYRVQGETEYMAVLETAGVTFTNDYRVNTANWTQPVRKEVPGLPSGEEVIKRTFRFTMEAYETAGTTGYGFRNYTDENGYTERLSKGDRIGEVVLENVSSSGLTGSFPTVYYDAAGTYTYLLKEAELTADDTGYTKDVSEYIVTVVVADADGDGTLEASATYSTKGGNSLGDAANVTFSNTYRAAQTDLVIPVMKTVSGISNETAQGQKFQFGLFEANESFEATGDALDTLELTIGADGTAAGQMKKLVYSAEEDAAGSAELYAGYTGTHRYVVKELTEDGEGYTADTAVYGIEVTVTDDGSGQLAKSVSLYKDGTSLGTVPAADETAGADAEEALLGAISFNNSYEAEGSLTVPGLKTVNGNGTLQEFQFGIYTDEAGETLLTENVESATVRNDSETGEFSFNLSYDMEDLKSGDEYLTSISRTYYIREIDPEMPGYTMDDSVYRLDVTVTDNGEGELLVSKTLAKKNDETGTWDTVGLAEDSGESIAAFENTYVAAGNLTFTGRKLVNGEVPTADQIARLNEKVAFELWQLNEDGTETNLGSVTLDEDGTFSFEDLAYTQEDIGSTYTYQIVERQTAADDAMDGYTIDSTVYTFTVEVADSEEHDGTLKLTVSDGSGEEIASGSIAAEFDNTYEAAGSFKMEGTKTLTGSRGKAVQAGEFNFIIEEVTTAADGAESRAEVGTGTTLEGGVIDFTEIEYTLADVGEHTYVVTEVIPAEGDEGFDPAITYSTQSFTVTVTVTDDGDGNLLAAPVYPEGGVSFVNDYKANGEVPVGGEKLVNGEVPTADQIASLNEKAAFELRQMNEDGTETNLGSVTLDEDGTFSFEDLAYTQEDIGNTYTYQIVERQTAADDAMGGYTIDSTVYTFTVEVQDDRDSDGTLELIVTVDGTVQTQPLVSVVFDNTYEAEGTAHIETTKTLNGRALSAGEFTFDLRESDEQWTTDGAILQTVVNGAGEGEEENVGSVVFDDLTYTLDDVGTHYYVITERTDGAASGITYDTEPVRVRVVVSDNGDGTLAAEVTFEGTHTEFTNEYEATGRFKMNGVKILEGNRAQEVRAGEFSFVIDEVTTAADGTQSRVNVGTGTTLAGGTIDFTEIEYTLDDVGEHTYVVTEVIPAEGEDGYDPTITYSTQSFTVTVTVTDDGTGTLAVTPVYPEGGVTFVNNYEAEGSVTLEAVKTLVGAALAEGQFTFELRDEQNTVLQTAVNGADGRVVFEPLTYTQDDIGRTYTYTISEQGGSLEGVTYDAAVYTAEVTIADNGDGTLNVTARYFRDGQEVTEARFTNIFEGSVTLRKTDIDGQVLPGAVFELYAQGADGTYSLYTGANATGVFTTDAEGIISVGGLPEGNYYFIETQAPDGYKIPEGADGEPMRYSFTIGMGTGNGDAQVHADLTVVNERIPEEKQIVVTKRLTYGGTEEVTVVNQTFYVALYSDPECTNRVTDIVPLVFENASSSSVTFTDLEYGVTYYVAETDADGNVLNTTGGVTADGQLFSVYFGQGNSAVLEEGDGTKTIIFENVLLDLPPEYYQNAELTLTKRLIGADGLPRNSSETFYAGIFSDAAHTTLSDAVSANIVPLNLNGGSETSVMIDATVANGEKLTLYVAEVTEDGTPVKGSGSFQYTVTVDGAEVAFDAENMAKTVTITNRVPDEDVPKDYYYDGELTITKELLGADGEPKSNGGTFYAGIFSDAAHTTLSDQVSENIVPLSMGGDSMAGSSIQVAVAKDQKTTLYVAEVTKDGTPVENSRSFRYDVTVDNTKVTFDMDNTTGSVTITNQERSEEETEPQTETEAPSVNRPQDEGPDVSDETPISQNSVRTGDETPIALYLTLFAAAAAVLLILFLFGRRKRRRK